MKSIKIDRAHSSNPTDIPTVCMCVSIRLVGRQLSLTRQTFVPASLSCDGQAYTQAVSVLKQQPTTGYRRIAWAQWRRDNPRQQWQLSGLSLLLLLFLLLQRDVMQLAPLSVCRRRRHRLSGSTSCVVVALVADECYYWKTISISLVASATLTDSLAQTENQRIRESEKQKNRNILCALNQFLCFSTKRDHWSAWSSLAKWPETSWPVSESSQWVTKSSHTGQSHEDERRDCLLCFLLSPTQTNAKQKCHVASGELPFERASLCFCVLCLWQVSLASPKNTTVYVHMYICTSIVQCQYRQSNQEANTCKYVQINKQTNKLYCLHVTLVSVCKWDGLWWVKKLLFVSC